MVTGQKIHSMRHADLEIRYLNEHGALTDKLDIAWGTKFQTKEQVDAWEKQMEKEIPPVFQPLEKYFGFRARVQKTVMALGLVPLAAAGLSILAAGVTSAGLLMGGIGLAIMIGEQIALARTQDEQGGLLYAKAQLFRNVRRMGIEKKAEIVRLAAEAKKKEQEKDKASKAAESSPKSVSTTKETGTTTLPAPVPTKNLPVPVKDSKPSETTPHAA